MENIRRKSVFLSPFEIAMFLENSRIEWFAFLQEIETFLQKIQMLQIKSESRCLKSR